MFTLRNELLFVLRNHTRTEHFRPVTLTRPHSSRGWRGAANGAHLFTSNRISPAVEFWCASMLNLVEKL